MPIDPVGLNITGIGTVTLPEFNITDNVTKFVEELPQKANEYSNNYIGLAVMVAIVFYLYYVLADFGSTSVFRYSQVRSIGLACGITGFIGAVMFSIGYFRQLEPVIFFIIIFMLCFIWAIKEEK